MTMDEWLSVRRIWDISMFGGIYTSELSGNIERILKASFERTVYYWLNQVQRVDAADIKSRE